jgi:hypothetical protein
MVKLGAGRVMAVILFAGFSPAALRAGEAEQAYYCREDVVRLCASSIPDRGRIITCMRAQRASLSQGCRTVFDEQIRQMDAARPAGSR